MKSLEHLLTLNKHIRVMGIDDAPFDRARGSRVNFSGVVCADTKMEGMVWGEASKDGSDATDAIIEAIKQSKFHPQLHLILLDGLAIGGFNIIDLPRLHQALNLPCVAVMRKPPDLQAIRSALQVFDDGEHRWGIIKKAGDIFHWPQVKSSERQTTGSVSGKNHKPQFYFQVQGANPEIVWQVLVRLTCNGQVPEALRLAHLIGAAIKTGVSGNSA